MEAKLEVGATIVIGSEFAEAMGYADSVGYSGIIEHPMSAVCEVLMLTGADSGKTLDIHTKDCLIQEEKAPTYSGIIHPNGRIVYYSDDTGLLRHTKEILTGTVRAFHNVTNLEEVLTNARMHYNTLGWKICSLDNINDEETASFRRSYHRKLASKTKLDKATKLVAESFKNTACEDNI